MEVTFCYDDRCDPEARDLPCVPEPRDEDAWARFAGLAAANEDDTGTVILEHRGGQVRIVDALGATFANFCLGAVPDLVDRKHVVVRHFLSYGYLRLDPEGSDMLLSGDHVPTVHLPRAELIPALVDAGRRFVPFFDRLHAGETDWTELRDRLGRGLAAAEEALERWDGT